VRERSASRIDAFVAALVAVLALGVSGYTAYLQRQQVRAQVWPYLSIGFNNSPRLELFIANKGVGPAIVERVRLTVDGKAYRDWDGLLEALLGPGKHKHGYSQLSGRVFAPNESADTLIPYDAEGHVLTSGAASQDMQKAIARIGVDLCYCSTLHDCWRLIDDRERTFDQVSHCPTEQDDDFRQ
jgi:hypothetical protein